MGILFDAFETMFAGGCLLSMNFILMFFFGLLRNLPAILHAARQILREILIMSYRIYSQIITRLQPTSRRYLGIEIGRTPMRIVTTCLISLVLVLSTSLVLGWGLSIILSFLAILHGLIVGLLWEELDQAEGQQMGEKIQ